MTVADSGEQIHTRLDSIEDAVAAVKAGRPVVVVDDADRENEGDLIFAAELATTEMTAFMVRLHLRRNDWR